MPRVDARVAGPEEGGMSLEGRHWEPGTQGQREPQAELESEAGGEGAGRGLGETWQGRQPLDCRVGW